MVSILASLFVLVGLGVLILGSLAFLIAAFRTSILWGLGVFFFGPLSLVYLIVHWSDAKKPFYLQLCGIGFIILASILSDGQNPWPLN
jgi:hypothetical protein